MNKTQDTLTEERMMRVEDFVSDEMTASQDEPKIEEQNIDHDAEKELQHSHHDDPEQFHESIHVV